MTDPSGGMGQPARVLLHCPLCATANRIPLEPSSPLRCGACRLDFDAWLYEVFQNLSAFWRAGVSTLAAVYRPSLFPLLERALLHADKPAREAAWQVLAEPIAAEGDDGVRIWRPPLYDQLTARQRATLRVTLPRFESLARDRRNRPPSPPRATAPTPPATATSRGAPNGSERKSSRAPGVRRAAAHERSGTPVALPDLTAVVDGMTLRELADGARELLSQLNR